MPRPGGAGPRRRQRPHIRSAYPKDAKVGAKITERTSRSPDTLAHAAFRLWRCLTRSRLMSRSPAPAAPDRDLVRGGGDTLPDLTPFTTPALRSLAVCRRAVIEYRIGEAAGEPPAAALGQLGEDLRDGVDPARANFYLNAAPAVGLGPRGLANQDEQVIVFDEGLPAEPDACLADTPQLIN